jgi:polysaccharide export outer membrane protein
MNSLKKDTGVWSMKLRRCKATKWVVSVCGLTMAVMSATAQEAPISKASSSAAQTDFASKPAPTTIPDNSRVDNKTYVIGENDLLDIDVWKEKEISRAIPVRPDGKITLPLIGEIQASGMTPLQLQEDIARRLKDFLANPAVTVIVSDPRSHHFNIVGQIAKPGTYPLSQSMTVLDAISAAGGFRDFAKETKVYVLRTTPGGNQERLPFNYKDAIKGKKPGNDIILKPGDTIVVP